MRRLTICFLLTLCFPPSLRAQTYTISQAGDTINYTDKMGLKQGLWQVSVPEIRGERAYTETGRYVNNRREGIWRRYSVTGDPMSFETYRDSVLEGRAMYFYENGSIKMQGSYRAVVKENSSRSIHVINPLNGKDTTVVIVEYAHSVRQGPWKYYTPDGKPESTVVYDNDQPVSTAEVPMPSGSGQVKKDSVPPVVQQYEKRMKKKK